MSLTWRDDHLNDEHVRSMLQQAERARLVEEALRGRPRQPGLAYRLYGPLMAKVGALMMAWGVKLHDRYGEFSSAQRRKAEDYLSAELEKILARG